MGNLCPQPDEKPQFGKVLQTHGKCPSNELQKLGICSNEDYRKYILKHRPDKGGDPAMFRRVQELYRSDDWDCKNDWRSYNGANPSCGSEMNVKFLHRMRR